MSQHGVWCRWASVPCTVPSVCWLRVFVPPVVLCLAPVSRISVLARITSPASLTLRMRDHNTQSAIRPSSCPDHSDNAFWPFWIFHVFNVILEVNKLTAMLAIASFTYIIISNGLDSKILCLPNDQNMFDTKEKCLLICHPHTQWSAAWH